jgi:hypothetical protein
MAEGQGYAAWAGIGIQSTLGTNVARSKFKDFISENIRLVPQFKQWNNAGGAGDRVNTLLGRHSEGALNVYGCFEGLDSLLKAAFGASSVATAVVSGTAYGHTFSLKSAMPSPGFSLEVNRDIAAFLYEGCKIDEVEFIQAPNDYLQIRFGIRGRNETQVSASSPAFPTLLKVHFTQLTFKVSTVATAINSYRILLKNTLTGFRGSTLFPPDSKEFIRGGKFKVSGSVSLGFEDVTRYNEFRNVTNVALEMKYLGDAISGGGGETNQLKLSLPQVNWEGTTPEIKGPGPVDDVEFPFTAFETSRAANDQMGLYLVNTATSVV